MSRVKIYVEGGGNGRDTKVVHRQGIDDFLKPLKGKAREKSWHWDEVCCGSREDTFDAFRNAAESARDGIVALLVDAEDPVYADPRAHLQSRDGRTLEFAHDHAIHLMVQTMEAWIVADPDALSKYYGKGFRMKSLPSTQNLETVPKNSIATALAQATCKTKKGE